MNVLFNRDGDDEYVQRFALRELAEDWIERVVQDKPDDPYQYLMEEAEQQRRSAGGIVTCENRWCGMTMPASMYPSHLVTCNDAENWVRCLCCNERVEVSKLAKHRLHCRIERCPHCGEMVLPRMLMMCPHKLMQEVERARTAASRRSTKLKQQNTHPLESSVQDEILALTDNGSIFVPTTSNLRGEDGSIHTTANSSSSSHNANPTTTSSTNNNNHRVRGATTLVASPSDGANTAPLGWSAATTSGEQIPRRHSVNSSPPPGLPNFAQTTTRPSLLTLAQKRGMGNPNTARFAPPMMGAVDDGGGGGGDPLSDDHRLSIIQRLWRRSLFVQRVRENFFRAVWEQLDLSSEVSGNTRMQARIQHGLLRSDASQSFAVTDSNTSNTSAAMSHNTDGMSTKDDDVSETGSVAAARHESMLPDASNGPSLRTLEMNDIIAGGLALPIPRDDDEDAWSTEANNGAEEPIHVRLSPHDDGTYMDVRDLDALGRRNAERKMLRAGTVVRIVRAAIAILQTRSPVTHVVIPPRGEVVVVGDLHGQMNDLCHLLSITGGPTARRYYIFNGDLVDRGPYGNEVILYVFALLITYPQYVFINRGNHEDYRTNVEYGFMTELMGKYSSRAAHIHELFAQSYAVMPLITVVDRRVAVLHGGVPRVACTLQEVEALGHVRDVPVAQQSTREEMILSDLLWNDPVTKFRSRQLGVQHQGDGWRSSKRGCGAEYLAAVTDRFLELNNLSMIIRSHEVVSSGFEMIHRNKSVTVFSASNYGGVSGNRGAIAIITKEARKPSFQTWYFKEDKKSVEKLRKGRGGSSTGATDEAMIDFVGMYPCSDEFLRSFYGPQSPLTADDVGVSSGGGSEANFSDSGTSFGSSRGSSMMNDSTASHNNNHHHHDGELGTTMDVDDELGEDGRDTSPIKPLPEVLATRELTGTASPSRRRRRASHNSSLKYRPHDLSTQSSHLSMMVQLRSIQSIRELIFLHRYGLLTAFNQVDELRTGIVYKVEWAVVMRDVLNMDLPWYYLCQFLTPRLEVDGIPAVEYVRFLRHFDSPFLQAYRRGWQRATVARVFSGVDMPDELVRAFTEDRSMTPVNSSVPAIPQSISQVPSMGSGALFDTRSNLLASSVSSTDDLWDGWKEVQVDFKSFATKIRSLSPTAAVMEDNDIYSFFAFFDREMYGHVFLGQMVERIGEVMDEGSDGEPELISGDLDFTTVRRNTDQSSATRARTAPQAATIGKPPATSGDVASNSSSTNRSTPSKFNGLLRSAKAFTSKPAPSPSSSGSEDSRQDKTQRIQLHRLSVRTPISFSDLDAERVVEEEAGSPPSTGSNPAVIITDATNDRAPTTFHLTSPQHGRSAAVPAPSAVGLVPITTSTNCAAASTTGGAGSSVAGSSGKMNVSIASPLLENTANSSTTHFERSIRVSGAPQPAAVGAVLDEEDLKRMEGLTREEIGFQMPWLYGTFIRIQEQLLGGNSVTRLQSIFTALNQDKDGRLSEKEFTPLVTLLNEQLEHPLSELQARIIFKCVRIDAMVQSSPYRQANLNLRHMDFHSHALGDLQPFVEPQRLADESVVGKRYVLLPEFIFILSISPVALVDETIFHSHVGGGTVALPAVAQAASAESAGSFPYGTQLFAVRGGGAPPTKLEVSTNSMQLTMKVLRERFGDGATLHEVLGALERLTPSENSCSTDRPRFLNSNTSRPHMRRLLSSNRSKASLERSATSFKSGLDTDASTPTSRPESAMRQYRLNILTEYRMTVPTLSPATGRHRLSIQTLTDAPSFISASHSTMLRPTSTMGNYAAATAATATFMPIQAPGSSAILTAGHRHFNSSVGSMSGAVPHTSTHTSTHTSAHPSSTRSRPPAIPAPPITRKSSPSPQETIPTLESQVTLTPDDSNLQHQPPSQSETQHAHSRHGSPAGPSTSHDSRGSGAAPSSPSMSIAISDATTSVGSPASPLKTTPVRLKRSTQSDFTLLRSRGGTGQSQAQSQRLKGSHTTTTTTNHNNTPPTMLMVPAGIHPLPLKPLQPTLAGSAAAARAQAGLSAGANNNNNNSAVPLPGVVPAAMSKSPSSSTLSTRTSTTAPAPSDQPCGGFRGAGSRPSTRPSSPPTPPPLGGASLESIRARLRTIKEKAHHHSSTLSEGGGGGGSSSSRCSSRLGRHNSRSRGHASSAGHA